LTVELHELVRDEGTRELASWDGALAQRLAEPENEQQRDVGHPGVLDELHELVLLGLLQERLVDDE
jgi:hypothetical protein